MHSHIDAGVKEHQSYQTKNHGCSDGEPKATGIGQQTHNCHGYGSTNKQVRYAATEARPRLVAHGTYNRLNEDTHQRWKYPEIAQVVRVGTKSGKDTRDVSTLQGVSNLYAEESETEVPQFPK